MSHTDIRLLGQFFNFLNQILSLYIYTYSHYIGENRSEFINSKCGSRNLIWLPWSGTLPRENPARVATGELVEFEKLEFKNSGELLIILEESVEYFSNE